VGAAPAGAPSGARLNDRVGSFYFVAPEVLRGGHDARCDLWSLGVIVYILLAGAPPFPGRTDRDILARVARAPLRFPARYFGHVTDGATAFLARLLERDVDKRLTAERALGSRWLRSAGPPRSAPAPAVARARSAARAFASLDAFRKLVVSVVAARLPASRLEVCRADFADLDRDGDGELTLSEFFLALGGEGGGGDDVGVEEAAALFDAADVTGDGRAIAFREFAALHVCGSSLRPDAAALRDAFDVLDADGCGSLRPDDLRCALGADRCVGCDDEDAGVAAARHSRATRGLQGDDDDDDDPYLDWPRFLAACEPLL
jgi:calcium-dependent protein kinase